MRALDPEEYRDLSLHDDAALPRDYPEEAFERLVRSGLMVKLDDGHCWHWRRTSRGDLALRIHRAFLASTVTL